MCHIYCGNTSSSAQLRVHLSMEMTEHLADHSTRMGLRRIMDNNFESKHTMMGASRDLGKSLVMLNRKII